MAPKVTGYRRVPTGRAPCKLCRQQASRVYRKADLMPLHPRCKCIVVPVVGGRDLGAAANRSLGGSDARVATADHGELGPLLVDDAQQHLDEAAALARTGEVPAPPSTVPPSPWHRDLSGIDDLAAAVDEARGLPRTKLSGGQSADVEMVELADGRRLVTKVARDWGMPDDPDIIADVRLQADAEQLASLVGRAAGAPVPRVLRDDAGRVWMDWVDGAPAGDLGYGVGTRDRTLLDLLDVLSGNVDRNGGNMIVGEGRLHGIDHGFAWGTNTDIAAADLPGTVLARVGARTTDADVAAVRRRLEDLRPDFDLLGRGDWLDSSLRRLDEVRPTAAEDLLS